jgi:hypothetical protein
MRHGRKAAGSIASAQQLCRCANHSAADTLANTPEIGSMTRNCGHDACQRGHVRRGGVDPTARAPSRPLKVLRTNTEISAAEVALKYKRLWMVEELFGTSKSLLATRPIFHRPAASRARLVEEERAQRDADTSARGVSSMRRLP